jgi:phage terminase large subunit GpA-like protein
MPPHTRQSSSATRAPGRKSVLFCPGCGHESPVDGDWQVQARGETLAYTCPACREVITERPLTAARTSPVSSPSFIPSAGGSLFARSVRLALAWAAWPCTPTECALSYALDESSRADPTSAPMYTSVA